jgi:hypothetical protein
MTSRALRVACMAGMERKGVAVQTNTNCINLIDALRSLSFRLDRSNVSMALFFVPFVSSQDT